MRSLLYILAFIFSSTAYAATFGSGYNSGVRWISIDGKIEYGDDKIFQEKVADAPDAAIFLSSPGGNVISGIAIGTAIHERRFVTVVPPDAACASICGLIWLGGAKRLMGDHAQIGFHAAYSVTNGVTEVSSVANALLGSYYARIGLSDRTIMFLTEAAPQDMRWLTQDDARSNDIAFVYVPRDVEATSGVPTPGATVPTTQEAQRPVERLEPPPLSVNEARSAARLTRAFNARFAQRGMPGIDVSIDACYKRATELSSWDSAIYCTALDVLAMIVDSQLAEAAHLPATKRNARPAVVWRSDRVADALGFSGDLLRDRGGAVALVAASKIDTTEDPQKPAEIAWRKDSMMEHRSVAKGSPCSVMASQWGQIDRGLGQLVGGICGAVGP